MNLDGNDLMQFIIHDGNASTIGNIIHTFSGATLSHHPSLLWDQQYFIAVMVGNDAGDGTVDQDDGCLSIAQGIPVVFRTLPTAKIIPLGSLMLDCDHTEVVLNGATSQGNGSLGFNWTGPTVISNPSADMIEVSESGMYVLTVEDPFGCSSSTEVQVQLSADLPSIILNGMEDLDCDTEMITISALGSSVGTDYDWNWTGNGVDGSTSMEVDITQPGTYSLQIINTASDCPVEETFLIDIDTIPPAFNVSNQYYLDCTYEQAEILLSIQNCTDCEIDWSTSDGHFLNINDPLAPVADATGIYQFSILNNDNGCTSEGSTEVLSSPEGPQTIDYQIDQPDCHETTAGAITVTAVEGGLSPYEYSLNGQSGTTEPNFTGLPSGNYVLAITDVNGCKLENSFSINDPEDATIDLGDDITISLGEEVTLNPQTPDVVQTYYWSALTPLNCEGCAQPSLSPTEETVVGLEIITEDGCVAEDRITIFVRQNVPYYIPNAFSPNDDSYNEFFRPYFDAKGVEQLMSMQVYDRWGALIYEERPASLAELRGWDGHYRDKPMNPGVFLYKIQVLFKNGVEEILSGDVTLIR